MAAIPLQLVSRSSSPATTSVDPAAALWDTHFSEPAASLTGVRAILAAPEKHGARTLAWAELTEGFHRLYFTDAPGEAREWLERAGERFIGLADRRGALLADTGRARLLVHDQQTAAARQMLTAIYPEAQRVLSPLDLFWVTNALCATYFDIDQIDEAIRTMYESLQQLRGVEMSAQLVTVLSNLSAALVTVGDYKPARELAEEAVELFGRYQNEQVLLYARSNLAESLLGTGDRAGALATVDAMLGARTPAGPSPRNHYCAIAAEVYALHGRLDAARHAVELAARIFQRSPGSYNEVHLRWAQACVAAAEIPDARALPALRAAVEVAGRFKHLLTTCKANRALAERCAALGLFHEAYNAQCRLFEANQQRLFSRANARYYTLSVQHELNEVRAERDWALRQRHESETLNRELEQLNVELSRKMREIEELQARLAIEAVHDPLTQLFNRRYLDSALPGLVASADRRGTPLTLALVDLDHFKQVNDDHGHLAGDRVLRRVGKLFASGLRPSDIVTRWGGEEFCMVFPDTDAAGAATALAALADKLRTLEVEWAGLTIKRLTFSGAVATLGKHGRTLADLVSAADRALYAAKDAGRDRILLAE